MVRSRLAGLCLLGAACVAAQGYQSERDHGVMTESAQRSMTPAQALSDLKAGNERFVSSRTTDRNWLAQAEYTADNGQYPKAIVLSCLDSRVPVEIVFDQGIGDLFVGRVAGNFENTDMLGSFEFGTAVAGSKLIVVLGHSDCGAVKGAIQRAELGNLTATLKNIKPAVEAAHRALPGVDADDPEFVQWVVEENVRMTVNGILADSDVIAGLVDKGELEVVGAWYDLKTGKVHWLD